MLRLPELFARIDTLKARLDTLRPLDREREARAMQKFRLWWNYHSNALEGNKLTRGETEVFLMEGLTAKDKPLKDHLDLKGHNEAISCLLEFIRGKETLTEAFIRELHRVLLVQSHRGPALTPDGQLTTKLIAVGQYKTSANHVRTPTGEIHYYATPEDTPARMHALMTWYREASAGGKMHLVEIAARFHHRFTDIHPFDDGNGRMSRLLMNLLLMQAGYPPAVIRLEERNPYLAALRLADGGEYEDFIALVGEEVAQSLGLFIRAAEGEDISEPTDTRKEIRLELERLRHVENLVARDREKVLAIYTGSFVPLVKEVSSILADFGEVFANIFVLFESSIANIQNETNLNDRTSLAQANMQAHITKMCLAGSVPLYTDVTYLFRGFRKGKLNSYDLYVSLQMNCGRDQYSITLHGPMPTTVKHLYEEQMTKDEIAAMADQAARHTLTEIQKRTKARPAG